MPEMGYCPLVPKGVEATVSSTRTGFAVDVTSDDSATVKGIIRRAELLEIADRDGTTSARYNPTRGFSV